MQMEAPFDVTGDLACDSSRYPEWDAEMLLLGPTYLSTFHELSVPPGVG